MPYQKLIKMEKFSKLRIKQLWDDCRIFAAWFSSIKHGKKIVDQKTGQTLTLLDCIKRYAKARGLLWALGYSLDQKKAKPGKTTPEFKAMFKMALPSIKYYYRLYEGKVTRAEWSRQVSTKMKSFGEIDEEKGKITVNPKKGDLVNTVLHEELHRRFPKQTEEWVKKKAKVLEKSLSIGKIILLLKLYKKRS